MRNRYTIPAETRNVDEWAKLLVTSRRSAELSHTWISVPWLTGVFSRASTFEIGDVICRPQRNMRSAADIE